MRAGPRSLWRHRDFMYLWGGQIVSEMGSQVTLLALPLIAVLSLRATTFEVAALEAAGTAAFLLVALQAGSLVDRWRKKRVLVWSDLLRGVLLASIPIAFFAGHLTLVHLFAVAFANSVLTVFFDVAYQSYLPFLVNDDQLLEGNAKIGGSQSFAMVSGPSLGAVLVGAIGAAYALVADVISFAVSTVLTTRIKHEEAPQTPRAEGARLRTEIAEGLSFVLRHPVLSKVVGSTATHNFFGSLSSAVLIVFMVRTLGASGRTVGLIFALGALGGLLGAAAANRLGTRWGSARLIWLSLVLEAPFLFATPLAFRGWGLILISVTIAGTSAGAVLYNVAQVSYRQAATPRPLLGRMNASVRFCVWGVQPLGNLAGGLLGTLVGIRPTLFIGAAGASLAVLWVLASPLRRVRNIADLPPELGGAPVAADPGDSTDDALHNQSLDAPEPPPRA